MHEDSSPLVQPPSASYRRRASSSASSTWRNTARAHLFGEANRLASTFDEHSTQPATGIALGPEPAAAPAPLRGIHPEPATFVEPLDGQVRQPRPLRVERPRILIHDRQPALRFQDAPDFVQHRAEMADIEHRCSKTSSATIASKVPSAIGNRRTEPRTRSSPRADRQPSPLRGQSRVKPGSHSQQRRDFEPTLAATEIENPEARQRPEEFRSLPVGSPSPRPRSPKRSHAGRRSESRRRHVAQQQEVVRSRPPLLARIEFSMLPRCRDGDRKGPTN